MVDPIYFIYMTSYLMGSIPFGLIFTRNVVDLRSVGSGNIGSTNVLRAAGKKIAAATLLCDMAKGWLPVYLSSSGMLGSIEPTHLYGIAAASVIGQIFPIWLRFKGGKGLATTLGVYLGLNPLWALSVILVWLLSAKITKISSVGALACAISAPIIAVMMSLNQKCIYFATLMTVVLFWTHRSNIQRLLCGQEISFKN